MTPMPHQLLEAPQSEAEREQFFRLVYGELHRIASRCMARQSPEHTLQPTALVNEAYLRLGPDLARWNGTDHFLRVAARAMRQILVDHGRGKNRLKRAPSGQRVELDDLLIEYEARSIDLANLDGALERLAERDPRLAELVELHFFGGQTLTECARLLGISPRQGRRWWQMARAFLHRELGR